MAHVGYTDGDTAFSTFPEAAGFREGVRREVGERGGRLR